MKLSINTKNKIILLGEPVNLGELFTELEELLPDLKWRAYSLEMECLEEDQSGFISYYISTT